MVVLIVVAVAVVLLIPGGGTKKTQEVVVPVEIVGASNIGSLHFELVYDITVLETVNVEGGTATGNALFEFNSADPGRVIVGIVSGSGISGDGSVAMITFAIKSKDKASASLVLENVVAHSSSDLSKMSVSYVAGDITVKDGSFTSPAMYFATSTDK